MRPCHEDDRLGVGKGGGGCSRTRTIVSFCSLCALSSPPGQTQDRCSCALLLFENTTFKSRWTEIISWAELVAAVKLGCVATSLVNKLWKFGLWDLPPSDGTEAPRNDSASGWTTCQRSRIWSSLWEETANDFWFYFKFLSSGKKKKINRNVTDFFDNGIFECTECVKEPRSHGYCRPRLVLERVYSYLATPPPSLPPAVPMVTGYSQS